MGGGGPRSGDHRLSLRAPPPPPPWSFFSACTWEKGGVGREVRAWAVSRWERKTGWPPIPMHYLFELPLSSSSTTHARATHVLPQYSGPQWNAVGRPACLKSSTMESASTFLQCVPGTRMVMGTLRKVGAPLAAGAALSARR